MTTFRPLDQVLTAKRKPDLMIPEDFPTLEGKGICVSVIAGTASLDGKRELSPIPTLVPVYFFHICLDAGKVSYVVEIPTNFEGFVYCIEGSGFINGQKLKSNQAAMMGEPWPCEDEMECTEVIRIVSTNSEGIQIVLIAGAPLKNDGDQYENFVRRTREEILRSLGVRTIVPMIDSPTLLYSDDEDDLSSIGEVGEVDLTAQTSTDSFFEDPSIGPIIDRRSMVMERLASRNKRSTKSMKNSWFQGVFKAKDFSSSQRHSRRSQLGKHAIESDDETSATSLGSRLFL